MLHVPEGQVHQQVGDLEDGVVLRLGLAALHAVRPAEAQRVPQLRGPRPALRGRALEEAAQHAQVELDGRLELVGRVVRVGEELEDAGAGLLEVAVERKKANYVDCFSLF